MRLTHLLGRAKVSVWLCLWYICVSLPQHPGGAAAAAGSPSVQHRVRSPWRLPGSTGSVPLFGRLGGDWGGTAKEMYYPQETLFQFFSVRQLKDIAEFVAELEKAWSVLAWVGRSSAEWRLGKPFFSLWHVVVWLILGWRKRSYFTITVYGSRERRVTSGIEVAHNPDQKSQ